VKMQLGLRLKLTMVMTALVLLMTLALSLVFLEQELQQLLSDTSTRADAVAAMIFEWAKHADDDARVRGMRPESDSPDDIHAFVVDAFKTSDALNSEIQDLSGRESIYEISIVDTDGTVVVSSDPAQVDRYAPHRPPLTALVQSPIVRQIKILRGAPQVYEVEKAFEVKNKPWEVRVAVQTGLLRKTLWAQMRQWIMIAALALVLSTVLAAVVSGAGADTGYQRPTGQNFRGGIRHRNAGAREDYRQHRRTGTGAKKNQAGGAATARGTRDFQLAAGKHEFGDGGAGGRADFVYARRARRDGEPGSGEVFGGASFNFPGEARDADVSAGASAV
jgi:hypothetical protein